ncbi:MAG TPA: S41 family peptidase, partial [Streptosporangiaceae bacterium]
MNCVTSSGYLRFPHLHGDLLTFVADNDVWLAPTDGGRAWRLTSDNTKAANPRFSPDGSKLAWTSWRDGDPEVYVINVDGTGPARLTYWGDDKTLVLGWTPAGEVVAMSAVGQPDTHFTWAYAIPLDGAPRRLPYGPVTDVAITDDSTALVTGRFNREPAQWKRYRGGTGGRLWTATAADPLFTRVHHDLPSQFGGVMLIGGRLVFGADHEGIGNIYSSALDGSDLRRHTDHDDFYARHPSSDGRRVVYTAAGDIWLLDGLDAPSPRRVEITLGAAAPGRAPTMITAADHLGGLAVDPAGQASVIEVRGTVHWLTHKEGPARALHVDSEVRARLPRVLGDSGKVVFATDGELRITDGQVIPLDAAVTSLAAAPDGALVAAATQDGKLYLADIGSGSVTEVAASEKGQIDGLSWSPDSAWLAWTQPLQEYLSRIRMVNIPDRQIVEVTDGRFRDSDPVFTLDGQYLAFLSRRSFDPIYDAQFFSLSFPFGARPYLVPLGALTPSPFAPLAGGRPLTEPEKSGESEQTVVHVDAEGLVDRVVTVPVPEARYGRLRAVKGGLVWLREPLRGVLGESGADLEESGPRPTLERFDFAKREVTELADEADWFEVSGDGTSLVVKDRDELRVLPSAAKADAGQVVTVDLARARFLADPVAQWRHAFDEAGRVMRRGFWKADMSGVDWDGVLSQYRPLLDRIRDSDDFADLLWELFGELGTSHAYVYAHGGHGSGSMGQLGADLARGESGEWVVQRVLRGESSDPRARSPLAAPGAGIRPGDAVLAVDGQSVDAVHGPWPLLAGTAGKPVELTIRSGADTRSVVVVPIRSQRRLRYQDWVASRRALTRELSDGRLGYLHIPNMVGEGWAHFNRDLHTEMALEGVIMDVRGNSGGHISQLVVSKLTPRVYAWDATRYQGPQPYPEDARRGPVVTLTDEAAGSDGDIVTAAIRALGLGPVVGARTWGGVIGINQPYELIEGTRMTIPGYSFAFDEFGWSVENYGVDPDVEVLITPDDWAADRDPQLETGVRMALEALDKQPPATPPDPSTAPDRARPALP